MLTERQLLIFQVIIDEFIKSAHPVGSRMISTKDNISVSAATIRNVMAELEEMGFLEKTHSSSGRVPSEKGYRYYVDHLIHTVPLNQELQVIKHMVQDGYFEFEQLVQMSAEVLSNLTNYTSIILGPEMFEAKLKQLQIIALSDHSAVAILITDTGHVEHRSFTIPSIIKPADLEKMVNILNDRLRGAPIARLPNMINEETIALMRQYMTDVDMSLQYLQDIFSHDPSVHMYVGGRSNILMQPEFKDVEKIHSFYTMMEDEEEIINLLKGQHDGIEVTIGKENKIAAIQDFSLITASYALGEDQMGTIALLGPTRMEYKKVIHLLNSLSNEMSEVLYKWYKHTE